MSCCGPKASTPAQQARATPENTGTPKGETAGCCGGAAKTEAQTPASAPQEAGAHSEACHTHAH